MIAYLLTLSFVLAQPANWWKDTHGIHIDSAEQLDTLMETTQFIMLDFYMEQCHWCFVFQAEWNQIVDDFTKWYGDKILFAKVNGP